MKNGGYLGQKGSSIVNGAGLTITAVGNVGNQWNQCQNRRGMTDATEDSDP